MIKTGRYIENSKGEKGYVGDIIKMKLYVRTALGDTGKILSIRDDAVEYDILGIIDFGIL